MGRFLGRQEWCLPLTIVYDIPCILHLPAKELSVGKKEKNEIPFNIENINAYMKFLFPFHSFLFRTYVALFCSMLRVTGFS